MVEIRAAFPRRAATGALLVSALVLQACATMPSGQSQGPAARAAYKVGKPYQVGGIWYVPREEPDYDRVGMASWYGQAFHMKATASGEPFDMNLPSAAHTTLPLPSVVEVTNLDNGRRLRVRVNDRGPFVGDRIIDLSREAARELGFERQGLARVRVRYVGRGDAPGDRATGRRYAEAATPVAVRRPHPTAAPLAPVTVAAPEPVAVAALPAAEPSGPVFMVQAGAFADQLNAQRAAAQLHGAGVTAIEPLERDGVTLYRVVVQGGADPMEAETVRQRVAAVGFTEARIVGPF